MEGSTQDQVGDGEEGDWPVTAADIHVHHWRLEMPPVDGVIGAACKYCHATRTFPAVPEELAKTSAIYAKRGPQPTYAINNW